MMAGILDHFSVADIICDKENSGTKVRKSIINTVPTNTKVPCCGGIDWWRQVFWIIFCSPMSIVINTVPLNTKVPCCGRMTGDGKYFGSFFCCWHHLRQGK